MAASRHGRVVVETIASAVLRDNPLGDPAERSVPVYLPPSYGATRRARFPVVHLLAGFTGCGRSFLNFQAYGETLPEKLDRLIGAGRMGEMIVAMPDCYTRLGGSQYLNSPATGRYEDHLVHEVVPEIDRRFRTLAAREHRGIAGKSSGGYGAMVLAMRHPDLFSACASHSGDCAFELCYLPDFPKFVTELSRHGTIQAYLDSFWAAPAKESRHVMMMNVLAMAAAYSPNRRRTPVMADLPFDLETAELIPAVWKRWLAWDPLRMAPERVAALRALRLFYVDAGSRDEFFLHLSSRILSRRLAELAVPHVREEFDGGHFNVAHRYDVSFPRLWEALAP
jgi:enterochelin esterase family protein